MLRRVFMRLPPARRLGRTGAARASGRVGRTPLASVPLPNGQLFEWETVIIQHESG